VIDTRHRSANCTLRHITKQARLHASPHHQASPTARFATSPSRPDCTLLPHHQAGPTARFRHITKQARLHASPHHQAGPTARFATSPSKPGCTLLPHYRALADRTLAYGFTSLINLKLTHYSRLLNHFWGSAALAGSQPLLVCCPVCTRALARRTGCSSAFCRRAASSQPPTGLAPRLPAARLPHPRHLAHFASVRGLARALVGARSSSRARLPSIGTGTGIPLPPLASGARPRGAGC
jgi:hypothetical protein